MWQCDASLVDEAESFGFRPPEDPEKVNKYLWCLQPMGYRVQQRAVAAECEQIVGERFCVDRSVPDRSADSVDRETERKTSQLSPDAVPFVMPGSSDRTAGVDASSFVPHVVENSREKQGDDIVATDVHNDGGGSGRTASASEAKRGRGMERKARAKSESKSRAKSETVNLVGLPCDSGGGSYRTASPRAAKHTYCPYCSASDDSDLSAHDAKRAPLPKERRDQRGRSLTRSCLGTSLHSN